MMMKAAVVRRPQHVMQILVIDDGLDEESWNALSVERGMDTDLGNAVIVRAESDAAPGLAGHPVAPAD